MAATVEKMSSSCGKFDIKLHQRLAAPLLLPHDTAATTCPTAAAAAAATAAATVSCSSCSNKHSPRHAHSKRSCGLIYLCIALLAIFGFTQNTNALPRQLYGRQYILRHHSRAHRHHVHQRAAGAEQMITIAAITPEKVQKSSKEFGPTLNQLQVAKDIANQSHKYIREMMENYVVNVTNTAKSEPEAATMYKLHYLNLAYPLHAEANGSFDPSQTELTEAEFLRILDSLSIIHDLVDRQKYRLSVNYYNNTFSFIKDKIHQNRAQVTQILHQEDGNVGMPEYTYNGGHDFLEYGVLQEAEKILILLEHKYAHMLKISMESGNP